MTRTAAELLHGVLEQLKGNSYVHPRKPYSGFPGEVSDFVSLVRQLQDLHGDVLVLNTEQLETGVGGLARLGVPVYLDCHIVTLWVPVDPHLCRQSCFLVTLTWRLTTPLS
jgi:hypothetical protein